ncbi:CorA family metal ion transporter, putative [Talaromyces stipitatus ATCC 10500]|uniref:CorA family metal ion transporter, putative n=1 Tax=Talaromyces stipitatus (strain ATCC 10500 / CBS 375.48 / QM 6759 / NRRL 1006) TaxID=441959 RepID=B8MC14_TALSN|nr:CorA family metal ion transporter, putative [Talaromyces stipitatus ATCC 10500]EED18460.1 CorA family metal ion transporter, putative [Talaromyces stipitatus ATCC 10500]
MLGSPRSETSLTGFDTTEPRLLEENRFDTEFGHNYTEDMSTATQQAELDPRPSLLQVPENHIDNGPISRDFEQAIVDDDRDIDSFARRLSMDPHQRHRTRSRCQQDMAPRSRNSSISSDSSSSPPNSVDAFADPRRRERANTVGSHVETDLDTILQRTVSGGTIPRRPTFSQASVARPDQGETVADDVKSECGRSFKEPGRIPVIDYEELEEFVALNKRDKYAALSRKHSMSSQGPSPRIFHDLRQKTQSGDVILEMPEVVVASESQERTSDDDLKAGLKTELSEDAVNEKECIDNFQPTTVQNRFTFFSSESQSTIHAAYLGDLILPGDSFRDLFQLGPEGGVWWLDIIDPTEAELGAISRAFSIHPLTAEDIMTQEAREKVELFKQYYFVCFRTFYHADKDHERYLDPVNVYMVVYRDGVLSFSFTENRHAANVRKRIGKLRDYVSLSSDWICYAMIDDIVDSFGPIMRDVEIESEAIEDHVFVARVEDFGTFLPRIGDLRKKVMTLMRLLGGKADVIRGFSKRCNEQYSVTPRGDIGLYLGDIQDHIVTMVSNLTHFEKMLSRSHSNYLAQLNVSNIMLGNHVNNILSKVTLIASLLVPMNLICGLWGMNVPVPGRDSEGLGWFFGIVGFIGFMLVSTMVIARCYKLV